MYYSIQKHKGKLDKMPDTQPYKGQSYGQGFNTAMTQQQAQAYAQQQAAWQEYYRRQQQAYGQIPQMTPQQQYNQQIQTAEREHVDYKTQINTKSRLALIAITTLFALILIGSVVYFMLPKQQAAISERQPKEEASQTIAIAPEQELIKNDVVIDSIKFCSDIDADFNCIEKADNTLDIGGFIYLYTRIRGFSQVKREEGNLIGVKEDIETIDPDGISVYQLTGTAANIADFISEGQNYLHLKNRITIPAELKAGAYTLKISVVDKITGKEASLEKGFWLE
jgi:hypothetical protein